MRSQINGIAKRFKICVEYSSQPTCNFAYENS